MRDEKTHVSMHMRENDTRDEKEHGSMRMRKKKPCVTQSSVKVTQVMREVIRRNKRACCCLQHDYKGTSKIKLN